MRAVSLEILQIKNSAHARSQCIKIIKIVSFEFSRQKWHFLILLLIFEIFEFLRQKSSILMLIFGAKIQIFQNNNRIKKCHFRRENSNETILMMFMELKIEFGSIISRNFHLFFPFRIYGISNDNKKRK